MSDQFRILCVCTGNVYRSRIAADEIAGQLRALIGSDAEQFAVRSAGTRAETGRPLEPLQARQLARLGLGVDLPPAHGLDQDELRKADLILTAEQQHRSVVLERLPAVMRRTFMLVEFARLTAGMPLGAGIGDGSAVDRAREVVAWASSHRAPGVPGGTDDIADPWGRPEAVLELAAGRVRTMSAGAVEALTGLRRDDDIR